MVSVIRSNNQAALEKLKMQSGEIGIFGVFLIYSFFMKSLLWVIVSLHNLGSSNSKIASMLTINRKVTDTVPSEELV